MFGFNSCFSSCCSYYVLCCSSWQSTLVSFNFHIYLFCLFTSYIFYILLYSKTSNVVATISSIIKLLNNIKTYDSISNEKCISIVGNIKKDYGYHCWMIFWLLRFKTQTEIIREISQIINLFKEKKIR